MNQFPPLLPENELIWSPVVANNRMNRERQASGVNSYEKELGFRPEDWLLEVLTTEPTAHWLDICCGKANALLQTAQTLAAYQDRLRLHGLDLVNFFTSIPAQVHCVQLFTGSVVTWQPPLSAYHFISCIHGLHYVGDKLKAIAQLLQWLAPNGKLVASFDLASVQVQDDPQGNTVLAWFAQVGIIYDAQQKLISTQSSAVGLPNFSHLYLGADDQAGKNYTGQEAVVSYYGEV